MGIIIFNLFEKYSLDALNFLLKQTIYTAILFVIILAISFFLRKKSPQWHFALWLLILVRLLLPTDLNLSISIRNIFDQIPNINKATASIDSFSENIKINQYSRKELALNNTSENQKVNANTNNNSNQRTDESIPWHVLAAFIWITGCLLMLIAVLRKYLKSRHIIKKSSFIQDDILTNLLTDWRHRLKIKRTVRIISSDEFLSPFSVGILKPLIHIPQSLIKSADMDTIHSIIAHEMVHIKHYDALWIKLQTILQIVYFFNPITWYANRQINIAREEICDSTALSDGIISPRVYGNSIIQVLNHNLFGSDIAELLPGFGNHKKIFKQRIQKIIKGNILKKPKTALIILAICLIGFFVLPLANNSNMVQDEKKSKNNDAKSIITNFSSYNINNSIGSNPKDTGPENLKHTQSINRSEIQQKVLNNIDNVLKGLRAGPYRINGNIEGYKLIRVSLSNIFYKLGARSGDIVKRVNDHTIDSTEKLLELWESVQGESKITLYIERGGKLHIFESFVKDEGNNSSQGNNSLEINSKDTGSESLKYIQSISRTEIWLIINNGHSPLQGLLPGGPYKVNGKIEGYYLVKVNPFNFLYEFGARSGDILKKVNGEVIDSVEKLMGLEEIMLRESKITLEIERGGKLHIFKFYVKDEGNNNQANNFIVPFDKDFGRIRLLSAGTRERINPISGMMELHFELFIIFPKSTPILAAASGEVIKAGLSEGDYGNLIILKHSNGYFTIYANLNKIFVKEGQAVKSGDTIAFSGFSDILGSMPDPDDPDFRYEIRKDGRPIVILPPEKYLSDLTIDPIANEIR